MMRPTPEPTQGAINWNMNTTCNYRCGYCTQRFMDDRGRWAADVPRFIDAFCALPGRWEIKLSGGEPFIHPQFVDVVAALSRRGFTVSVVTNFSATREKLDAFLDAAGPNLGIMSCSLHLDYVDPSGTQPRKTPLADFLSRVVHVKVRMPSTSTLCVTCVATRESLPLMPDIRTRFDDVGVVFKIQPEKQDGEIIEYNDDERTQLLQLGGHNRTGTIAANFRGRPCWAGSRYFVVDDRGNAFRCYPARRKKTERLGNLLDGTFRLMEGPSPCIYAYCNCTVPMARGMMPTQGAEEAVFAITHGEPG